MFRTSAALAVASTLLISAAAHANTYDVYSCWAGYGTFHNPNASTTAWVRDSASAGGRYTTGDDCGIGRSRGALSVLSMSGAMAALGQHADLVFAAPSGSTLAGATLWRRAWSYGSGSGSTSQRNALTAIADGSTYLADADGSADAPYGTKGTGDTTEHGVNPSNALTLNLGSRSPTSFAYRVGCTFGAGCPTTSPSAPVPSYSASGVDLFGSVVTIKDTTAPSLVVGTSGLFNGQNAAGITIVGVTSARDTSGIKRLSVFADDGAVPVGVVDYGEDVNWCDWSSVAPCQNASSVDIPVDTTALVDGLHSFVVKAFDAADNERASTTHYVTVRNQTAAPTPDPPVTTTPDPPTTTPDPPGTTDPQGTGSGAPSADLPNGTTSGGGGGVTDAGPPRLVVTFEQNGRAKLTAKYGRMVDVRGTLVDGGGGPISNAQIGYSALSTRAGARTQNLGAVRTDSSGTFHLSVATKLGSRSLHFAYSPTIGGSAVTSAAAQLDVVAPLSLKLNHKTVRNGSSVVFSGRLTAGPIPRKCKLVNLQVVVDGHWHTFATVRSYRSGRFKYRYRFTRTFGAVRYRFRALSRYEAAYPFVAGYSKTVKLLVFSCPIACD